MKTNPQSSTALTPLLTGSAPTLLTFVRNRPWALTPATWFPYPYLNETIECTWEECSEHFTLGNGYAPLLFIEERNIDNVIEVRLRPVIFCSMSCMFSFLFKRFVGDIPKRKQH
jgi:hypothetical protein